MTREPLSKADIDTLLRVASENAGSNGLDLKPLASDIRKLRAEYLKVNTLGGRLWPNGARLGFFSGEQPTVQSPTEQISSYRSYLATMQARGSDSVLHNRLLIMTWLLRRAVIAKSKKGSAIRTRLPMMLLFTPKVLGGVGHLPGRCYIPQADALIAHAVSGTARDAINAAAAVMATTVGAPRDKAAKFALESGAFDKGIRFVAEGLIRSRILESQSADRFLAGRNITPPFDMYHEGAHGMVKNIIRDSPKIGALVREEKLSRIAGLPSILDVPHPAPDRLDSVFPWIRYVKISVEESMPMRLPVCPVAALTPDDSRLLRAFGVSPNGDDEAKSIDSLFSELSRDQEFLSYIRPEQVASYVVNTGIANRPEIVSQVLTRSGASAQTAAAVAEKIMNNAHRFAFLSSHQGYGASGDFIQLLDLSRSSHTYAVRMSDYSFNTEFASLLRTFGMAYAVSQRDPHFIKIWVDQQDIPIAMGSLNPAAGAFLKITPGFYPSSLRL